MDQKESGFSREKRESGFSRDKRESGSPRDTRESGPSRDRRDSGPSRDRRDSGPSRDRRDSGSSRDRRDSGSSRDRRDSVSPRDRRDSGFSRDRRDSGFSRDKRETSASPVSPEVGIAEEDFEMGSFVLPGELVGTTEEFRSGTGTSVLSGDIYSTATGRVRISRKARVVSVLPSTNVPNILKVGDVVFGKVTDVRESAAMVEIAGIEGKIGREIVNVRLGDLHVSNVRDSYVKRLADEFRPSDIIRAKVIDVERMRLTTSEDSLGVMKAYCSNCRGELELDGKKLKCPVCNKTETRKISTEYGKGIQ
ncbi:exosome complex RNA-binding protein Csl4 [Methanosarcina sp. KYL-1]|uniref:exosome complex RNA-binding protein Csl4 n=1 Tax=Methanosarcina sp. KYL-1 TaxID=2602068 RepID=UPI002100F081|nr:exosome complex RNA-binding protein Csl4 [Methanosarcina sp. KYL-1]